MRKIGNYTAKLSRYVISREEWLNTYKNQNGVILVSDNSENVTIDIIDFVTKDDLSND